jgi:hypothetical protein
MIITLEQLIKINGYKNTKDCAYYIDALNEILSKYQIDTTLRIAHFLAQIIHESGYLFYKLENLNYSKEALRSVFPKYFPDDAIAAEYARKPERIANRVYAGRMGNSDEKSVTKYTEDNKENYDKMVEVIGHDRAAGNPLPVEFSPRGFGPTGFRDREVEAAELAVLPVTRGGDVAKRMEVVEHNHLGHARCAGGEIEEHDVLAARGVGGTRKMFARVFHARVKIKPRIKG